MKKFLWLSIVLVLCAPAAFADEAPSSMLSAEVQSVEAPQIAPGDSTLVDGSFERVVLDNLAPAAVETAQIGADGLPTSALASATQEAALGFSCPWYSTYCSYDRQCDSYCGAKGAGVCERRCCACLF